MNKYLFAILGCVVAMTTACDDRDDEITSIDYDRPFSPTGLEARVQNNVNVRLMWTSVADGATYTIEVYEEDEVSYSFTGTPVFKVEGVEGTEYTVEDLDGDTTFSAYIQAVVDGKKSNYKGVSFTTGGEQSLTDVVVDGNTITVYWKDGSNPTNVVIRLNDEAILDVELSAEDLANGYYVVEGLDYETKYTVRLKRDDTNIGETTATTSFDPTLGTPVSGDGADLAAAIAEVEDGGTLLLQEGTYILTSDDLGNLDKVITIQGATSDGSKPVIVAKFGLTNGGGISIKNCVLNGDDEALESTNDFVIEVKDAGSNLSDILIEDCEIYNYTKGIIYDNKGGIVENITVNNCIISNVNWGSFTGGGEMIDLRLTDLGKLEVTNSTIYNCVGNRGFLYVRDPGDCTQIAEILVDHCTLDNVNNVSASSSNNVFACSVYSRSTFTWTNNLVTNCCSLDSKAVQGYTASGKVESNDVTVVFRTNYYYNSDYLVDSNADGSTATVIDSDGITLGESPYTDPENADFTVTDEDLIYYGIGDPRWIK